MSRFTFDTPKDTLLEQLRIMPRCFANNLAHDTTDIVIYATRDNAVEACRAVTAHCGAQSVTGIVIHKNTGQGSFTVPGLSLELPLLPPSAIASMPEATAVVFWKDCIAPDILYHLETVFCLTTGAVLFPRLPLNAGRRKNSTLYGDHADELEALYTRLADGESRLSFASVVKALLTGEIEYLRPPVCAEYQHPAALPKLGDIVLDAGLFDSTVLRTFALTVGASGHVHGFKPEPTNFAYVQQTLQRFGDPGNISLHRLGVYSHKATMRISDEGASGRLNSCVREGSDFSMCEVIDIDSFLTENPHPRRGAGVDLIKMDIEGAEIAALRGAENTIRTWRPKLHICAYHNVKDLLDIPRIVLGIRPDYDVYFTSHVPFLNEYVYYFA